MGYYASSVYAVSPNDTHAFFIYYIRAATRFEFEWINEGMTKNFERIAEIIGPHKGVIIAPTPKHDQNYLSSLLDMSKRRGLFSGFFGYDGKET